jgi:hypothetical protein
MQCKIVVRLPARLRDFEALPVPGHHVAAIQEAKQETMMMFTLYLFRSWMARR